MDMMSAAIGGGLGAASSVLGGIGRNRALRKQMRMVKDMKKENEDWYNRRYNEDATQRADAQAALTQTQEAINERNNRAAGAAAVMGGTEESVAATKAANAQAMADTTSAIVQNGEARKDNIETTYREKNDQYNQQLMQLKGQMQSGFDLAGGAMAGAAAGIGASQEWGQEKQ